ncbi:hypothetical protein HZH68_004075 [Vespula germanica]|uniref:Uncharacterized protein n=1 Tax=Vespula germanica TaxID=30212 RepID=A0A836V292_VESGE|nr:hypothetical protein HZH68_004075 [Vespula germanica]
MEVGQSQRDTRRSGKRFLVYDIMLNDAPIAKENGFIDCTRSLKLIVKVFIDHSVVPCIQSCLPCHGRSMSRATATDSNWLP